jgi:hypothetical protein
MARTAPMDEHGEIRILSRQRTRHAGVVEMDMGEKDLSHIAKRHPVPLERGAQYVQARRRTGVHERNPARTLKHGSGNDLGSAETFEIDVSNTRG